MSLMLGTELLLAGAAPIRPQDVFATSLHTGNGGTQTITNGLDLAGKGGLVWAKRRNITGNNLWNDTLRGPNNGLTSNDSASENLITNGATFGGAFLSNGFSMGNSDGNVSGSSYAAWSFRRAKKFFDIVTYTGNGQSGRQMPHGLGDVPGMMIIRPRNLTADWQVYHRSLPTPQSNSLRLNLTDGATGSIALWNNTPPTATDFTLGSSGNVNNNGTLYVAYLFAHNPDLIQCVSVTANASGAGSIDHGWANGAQFALIKSTSTVFSESWEMLDQARSPGWAGNEQRLQANSSAAEDAVARILSDTEGVMSLRGLGGNRTYIAMLVRAPT
ncbi:DUF7483 domain-containing protein [Aureimonas ureilytica]|uniref:DUF7483 domain-containing protein n=1 Tax=Aureimonas ureilytica TaxID=401562 RepID=UPI00037A7ADE|nr:hypothetical protein [Aureimonas ureilytica]